MNVPLVVGIAIIAAVFAGLFIVMGRISGWWTAVAIWAGTLAMVGVIGVGLTLIGVGLSQ